MNNFSHDDAKAYVLSIDMQPQIPEWFSRYRPHSVSRIERIAAGFQREPNRPRKIRLSPITEAILGRTFGLKLRETCRGLKVAKTEIFAKCLKRDEIEKLEELWKDEHDLVVEYRKPGRDGAEKRKIAAMRKIIVLRQLFLMTGVAERSSMSPSEKLRELNIGELRAELKRHFETFRILGFSEAELSNRVNKDRTIDLHFMELAWALERASWDHGNDVK